MSDTDIIQWSAVETVAAIRAGRVGVAETVEAHLQRIERVNPRLNAVIEPLADQARACAVALDNNKEKNGVLFGVPVTTKSNVDQKGCATSNGVPAFDKPQHTGDAPVVHNLKDSAAVIIGRTSTPEFSLRWFTSNPLHGETYNPRNKAITPGGSSGGAAAAVASGIGCIAHGNDLGGSLRYLLADGTPVGVQLVGAPHCEESCLQAAEWIEQRNGLPTTPVTPVTE